MIQDALRKPGQCRALSSGWGIPCLLIVMLALSGCDDPVERTQLNRISSPTGDLEAVLVRSNAGATTGFVFSVHIVRNHGSPSEPNDAVIGFDRTDDVDVEWIDDVHLRIRLTGGRILHRREYWPRPGSPDLPRVEVSILHDVQDDEGSTPPEARNSD